MDLDIPILLKYTESHFVCTSCSLTHEFYSLKQRQNWSSSERFHLSRVYSSKVQLMLDSIRAKDNDELATTAVDYAVEEEENKIFRQI